MSVLAIITGVTKRTRLIRMYAISLILLTIIVLICCLFNITTYADDLTTYCAENLAKYSLCEHMRLVALVLLCSIVATNVLCCALCIVSAFMFDYTNRMDNYYRSEE